MRQLVQLADQLLYFFIAVVIVNSVGLWLPFVLDWFSGSSSRVTYEALPNNAMTYFGGIAAVSIYDRLRKVMNMESHLSKNLELSFWVLAFGGIATLIFRVLKCAKEKLTQEAISLAIVGILVSYAIWWVANYKNVPSDPLNALGGKV